MRFPDVDSWGGFNDADVPQGFKGHAFETDEYGNVDLMAYAPDGHNGPVCTVCKESFCMHCTPPSKVEPCEGRPSDAHLAWEARERLNTAAPELLLAVVALCAWGDHPSLTGLAHGAPVVPSAPSFHATTKMVEAAVLKATGKPIREIASEMPEWVTAAFTALEAKPSSPSRKSKRTAKANSGDQK